jgi:hypothetical protein
VPPLEVVLANDGARIEGVVRAADGRLVPEARIILTPPGGGRDPLLRFHTVVADGAGVFSFETVPPGVYRLLALDTFGNWDSSPFWTSPDFLRQYELRGELITVDPGARLTINPEAISPVG